MVRWDDATLDAFRTRGDELADQVIANVYATGDRDRVRAVLDRLVYNDQSLPADLPPELAPYFAETDRIAVSLGPASEAGENLFREHGPLILLILGCYSLPAAYAANKGVQVLAQTGYLKSYPNRRLVETSQMILDVMRPGGLGPRGKGIRTIQKVRLIHAAIRHMILHRQDDKGNPIVWNTDELGVPINQEDLAGTLMTFSYLVLDGLDRLRVNIDDHGRNGYVEAWRGVGRLMGVDESLIPSHFDEAKELTTIIQTRQIKGPSQEGQEMTRALLQFYEGVIPGTHFDGFAPLLFRFFLPSHVADDLGVPAASSLERGLVDLGVLLADEIEESQIWQRRDLLQQLSLNVIELLLTVDRGGQRTRFEIPDTLRREWKLEPQKPWLLRIWACIMSHLPFAAPQT